MKYERNDQVIMEEFSEGAHQAFGYAGFTFKVDGPPPVCLAPFGPEDPGCPHVHSPDLPTNRHLDEIPRDFYENWPGWTVQRKDP